ncbi:Nucleic acid binding [Mycena venus]|uniref:Nucleic acid binding n=1 Tax=Mycena venus TaxID=2733690 RepID=A0A8H6XYT3_9AGAR|nr:Nucleic acid binding [Mycena venus]
MPFPSSHPAAIPTEVRSLPCLIDGLVRRYDGLDRQQPAEMIASSNSESPFTRHFPRRFFVLKCPTEQAAEISVQSSMWAAQKHNEAILNRAYRTAQDVFLIFSVSKSKVFYGYARMDSLIPVVKPELEVTAPSPDEEPDVEVQITSLESTTLPTDGASDYDYHYHWGEPFRIAWHSTTRIPFSRARNIRNPWNHDQEVRVSRDGTELETGAGEELVGMWGESAIARGTEEGAIS